MKSNIKIHIGSPVEPPVVFIDEIKYPIVSIEYDYETNTNVNCGSHRLLVEYLGKGNEHATVYVGFDKRGYSFD